MNLVLFQSGEIGIPLPASDARVRHVREVLKRRPRERFDAGIVNQAKGKAWLEREDPAHVTFAFESLEPCPPAEPGALLCGLCRPQTVRKIVRECAALGIGEFRFFPAERSEPSYAQASLWTDGELDALLLEAAQQAFTCRVAVVSRHASLAAALAAGAGDESRRLLALDNYEATDRLANRAAGSLDFALIVGPERGWSPSERDFLRLSGCPLCSIGPRVLRTETACVAGLTIVRAANGLM